MDRGSRSPVIGAAKLALAIPLVCAVLIGSLWLGQQLRAHRAPEAAAATPAEGPTLDASSQAGAPALRGQQYPPPTPTPIPQSKDQSSVAAGFVRVEHPEGGWSVVMPKTWYRRNAPMHGSEILSYDPDGMNYSGNVPPADQVRVVIEAMNDYGATDPRSYAQSNWLGLGKRSDEIDLLIGGRPAYAATFASASPPPWPNQRIWFVRSPYFSDRMFVVQATANVRASDVDAIMASLKFFKPAPSPAATITRAQVTAQYSKPTYSATRVDKVEAKMVKWKEYEEAVGNFRSGMNDPDELTWVVIVWGEIQPPNHGPCCRTQDPAATPQIFKWEVHAFSAVASGIGGMYSCCGPATDPPTWWDKLVDLAKP